MTILQSISDEQLANIRRQPGVVQAVVGGLLVAGLKFEGVTEGGGVGATLNHNVDDIRTDVRLSGKDGVTVNVSYTQNELYYAKPANRSHYFGDSYHFNVLKGRMSPPGDVEKVDFLLEGVGFRFIDNSGDAPVHPGRHTLVAYLGTELTSGESTNQRKSYHGIRVEITWPEEFFPVGD